MWFSKTLCLVGLRILIKKSKFWKKSNTEVLLPYMTVFLVRQREIYSISSITLSSNFSQILALPGWLVCLATACKPYPKNFRQLKSNIYCNHEGEGDEVDRGSTLGGVARWCLLLVNHTYCLFWNDFLKAISVNINQTEWPFCNCKKLSIFPVLVPHSKWRHSLGVLHLLHTPM